MAAALDALRMGMAGALTFDAPQYVLCEIVSRAASEHIIKARHAAERQADTDARRARADQDRAFASYADNIAAAQVSPWNAVA